MKINELVIKNYKSIQEIKIVNPNPFTVFVGPNAAGKSNIFDAIEFFNTFSKNSSLDIVRLFGDIGNYNLENKSSNSSKHFFEIKHESTQSYLDVNILFKGGGWTAQSSNFFDKKYYPDAEKNKNFKTYWDEKSYQLFFDRFSRIFTKNKDIEKFSFTDDIKLSLACGNLEQVLKRILENENKQAEIVEWLELLTPGFKNIEIKTEELSGSTNLLVYEKGIEKPLNKKIISDGTYNIIALLAALYQSDEPQFLCIEEPENGLNPKVVKELVSIFRKACKEKGHFIWLNTHSQTLVSELTSEEIILVDKVKGNTQIKQIQGMDLKGMRMDEALLTNAIGGGIPW